MTAEREFNEASEVYNVEWENEHAEANQYAVYGWAKLSGDVGSAS